MHPEVCLTLPSTGCVTFGKSNPSLGPPNKRSSWTSKSNPEKEAWVVADSFITSHCGARMVPGTQ